MAPTSSHGKSKRDYLSSVCKTLTEKAELLDNHGDRVFQ